MMPDTYYIVKVDKNHLRLLTAVLTSVDKYPYDKNFLYFIFKMSSIGAMIPIASVQDGIIDMTFTCSYNFGYYF